MTTLTGKDMLGNVHRQASRRSFRPRRAGSAGMLFLVT